MFFPEIFTVLVERRKRAVGQEIRIRFLFLDDTDPNLIGILFRDGFDFHKGIRRDFVLNVF